VQVLDLGVGRNPLKPVLRTAIETCNRLFMRTLKRRSQFSSLVEDAAAVAWCSVVGHVRVESSTPLVIGLACDGATTAAIASAFLSMPDTPCDDVLAQDARGS